MKLPQLRPLPATLLTFALLAAVVFAFWSLLKPAPPKRIVMSTGAAGGAYAAFGELGGAARLLGECPASVKPAA
jgi:hypothetical protein